MYFGHLNCKKATFVIYKIRNTRTINYEKDNFKLTNNSRY